MPAKKAQASTSQPVPAASSSTSSQSPARPTPTMPATPTMTGHGFAPQTATTAGQPASPASQPARANPTALDFKARYADQLEELQSMGFEDEKANLRALVKTSGDMDRATELLGTSAEAEAPPPQAAVSSTAAIACEQGEVIAHVYDISGGMARSMSQMMIGKHMDLLPHTGIVVFGKEFFCSEEPKFSEPGKALPSSVQKTIRLGKTTKTIEELTAFLETLKPEYTKASYNLMTHNSNHYADAVSKFLLDGQGLPKELLSLLEDLQSTPQGQTMAGMLSSMSSSVGGSFFSPTGAAFHGGTAADPAFVNMLSAGSPGASAPADPRARFASQLAQLVAMGFSDEELCLKALAQTQGRVDAAINIILASAS